MGMKNKNYKRQMRSKLLAEQEYINRKLYWEIELLRKEYYKKE